MYMYPLHIYCITFVTYTLYNKYVALYNVYAWLINYNAWQQLYILCMWNWFLFQANNSQKCIATLYIHVYTFFSQYFPTFLLQSKYFPTIPSYFDEYIRESGGNQSDSRIPYHIAFESAWWRDNNIYTQALCIHNI